MPCTQYLSYFSSLYFYSFSFCCNPMFVRYVVVSLLDETIPGEGIVLTRLQK